MMKAVIFSFLFAMGLVLADNTAQGSFFYPPYPGPVPMAPWFPVQAQVLMNPGRVDISVRNFMAAPVVCSGQAWGQMASGYQGWVVVNMPPIYPGMFGYTYLTPFAGDFFVAANAYVWCRYF